MVFNFFNDFLVKIQNKLTFIYKIFSDLILQEDYLESLDYLDNIENGFTSVHSRIARQAVTTTTQPTTTQPSTTTEKNTNCRPLYVLFI